MDIDTLSLHPIVNLFPPATEKELHSLAEDIQMNGLREPIVIVGKQVIDGRNRLQTCKNLGHKNIKTHQWDGKGSLSDFVISENLHRRHLTASQKAAVAATALPFYEAEAKKRQQEHGKTAPGKKKNTSDNNIRSDSMRAVDQAHATFGVSPAYISSFKTLAAEAPKLAGEVFTGKKSLSAATRKHKRAKDQKAAAAIPSVTEYVKGQKFACIVIDPPWDVKDEGDVNQMGRAKANYATMTIAEVEKLPIADLAEKNCHLYLWITNRSLPKGFGLLEAWGFRYVTMLTWCKPSIGIGNYFRNNTEHILFGIKGKLSLLRQDVGTWFQAKREGQHSTKPATAYDIIASCSRGPRLEMFTRQTHEGFTPWGNL